MGITPRDPAHFDPAMGDYKNLKPFRLWCQKVLPLVYDDSLSYYEVLCKVVDYLNKTMEDVGVLHDDVDALHTAYQQLQSYVNDYFSTLDVQEEINNKLDVMAEDGTLDALLLPYFNAYKTEINGIVDQQNQNIQTFENGINSTVGSQNTRIHTLESRMDTFSRLAEGSTTGDAELADIRVAANGITYPTAGDAVRAQYDTLQNRLENYGYYRTTINITWKQGIYEPSTGGWLNDPTRCCSTNQYNSVNLLDNKIAVIAIDTDKQIRITFYDSTNTMIQTDSNWSWQDTPYETSVPNNANSFSVSIRYKDDHNITPPECSDVTVLSVYENDELITFVNKTEYDTFINNNREVNLYNLLNENVLQRGYVGTNGIVADIYSENAQTSDYLRIDPTKNYTFKTDRYYNGVGFCWYDESKTFLIRDNTYPNPYQEITKTPPINAIYLRITLLTRWSTAITIVDPITPEVLRLSHTKVTEEAYKDTDYLPFFGSLIDYVARDYLSASDYNDFEGKTISILGDSISTFAGYDPEQAGDGHTIADGTYTYEGNHCRYPNNFLSNVNQTYWFKLLSKLRMNLGVNESWAGTRVTWNGSETSDTGANKYIASQTRINHLDENGYPDLILVNAGTNDIGALVPIGTFNTENPVNYTDEQIAALPVETFSDAYRALLIRLQKTYPSARVIVMLPDYTTAYYSPTNADKYLEVIKEECDFFGVPYIDMRTVGITMYNISTYMGDGVHPNPAGMELMYHKLLKFFMYSL